MLPRFNFKRPLNEVTATKPFILPQAPKPLNDPPPAEPLMYDEPVPGSADDGEMMLPDPISPLISYDEPVPGSVEDDEMYTPGFIRPHSNSKTGGASGGYGKKRVGEESRKQMNLTGNRRSSILTTNK